MSQQDGPPLLTKVDSFGPTKISWASLDRAHVSYFLLAVYLYSNFGRERTLAFRPRAGEVFGRF